MHSSPYLSNTLPQFLSNLPVGKFFLQLQLYHFLLIRWELGNGLINKFIGVRRLSSTIRWSLSTLRFYTIEIPHRAYESAAFRGPLTLSRQEQIQSDSDHPCAEQRLLTKGINCLKCIRKGILYDILQIMIGKSSTGIGSSHRIPYKLMQFRIAQFFSIGGVKSGYFRIIHQRHY